MQARVKRYQPSDSQRNRLYLFNSSCPAVLPPGGEGSWAFSCKQQMKPQQVFCCIVTFYKSMSLWLKQFVPFSRTFQMLSSSGWNLQLCWTETFLSLWGAAQSSLSSLQVQSGPVLMDFPEDQKTSAPGDAAWAEDEDDGVQGGAKEAFRSKPRFSYTEVKLLLDEVKKNRHILLKKFNRGVSVDAKKQKWSEITDRINGLGENHRETRQIMKKWADLKCDGKRRLLALRGPNGSTLRKKRLGPVERLVQRILMLSPSRDGGSDQDWSPAEDFPRSVQTGSLMQPPAPYSYLNLSENSGSHGDGLSFDMSPLSSPENEPDELIHSSSEFDQADDEGPSSQDVRQRIRPVFTYSRTQQNQSQTPLPAGGAAAPPPPPAPRPSPTRLSSQSLQQQRAGRLLLGSVSRSLEVLTRSVQLLVESQQEFVQESLQLQRDAVDVLRDFSETALRMLRHKTAGGPDQNHQQNPDPAGSQPPASRF